MVLMEGVNFEGDSNDQKFKVLVPFLRVISNLMATSPLPTNRFGWWLIPFEIESSSSLFKRQKGSEGN